MPNQRKIFKKTLDWVQDRIDKGILNSTSGDLLEEAQGTLRAEIGEYFKKLRRDKEIYNKLAVQYRDFFQDFQENHKGITKASIKDLKPKMKKELEKRVTLSFNLMKNQENELKQKMASRFLNWVSIDSKEVRGNTTSKQSLLNFLDFAKENGIAEDHAKFILKDQTRKMITALDFMVADQNGAIAGVWKNRGDRRVVGNPNGLYPTGNLAHGDHWDRENKVYLFKNSWAVQKGFAKSDYYYEDLEDGGVGVAIGCRCRLEMIYDLRDLPTEFLTKKGKELLEDAN